MFGERYFATRERLADLMREIVSLAKQTGAAIGDILPVSDLSGRLGTPFLFVACGEVNSGKSTLLNGLFGHQLSRVSVLPETNRVLVFRYGPKSEDIEVSPVLRECLRPLERLKDFNWVDTPGTNSAIQGHLETTLELLPQADLILFVFPISNPWGSATWDFLGRVDPAILERVLLILQQADQRDPGDVQVILGHMRDLSMKRIGRTLPIFPVSGKLALQAKSVDPIDRRALAAAGFAELEEHISRSVCGSIERRRWLESWWDQAAKALQVVEERIEEQTRGLSDQGRFLEEIEGEIDMLREQFVTRLPRHLSEVAEVFQTEAVWVSAMLRRRLGTLRSVYRLFVGDQTGLRMETLFIERLERAVEAVAQKDGAEVLAACRSHWAELGQRVRAATGVELGGSEPLEETLAAARTRFVTRLGRAARQGIGNLKVRHQLDKELRRRNLALKSFTFTTLALITIGATCGAFGLPWLPGIFCGLAALFWLGGIAIGWSTKKAIVAEFQDRLLDTCGSFASTLRTDYEEALRVVFQDYTGMLEAVRKHLAKEKAAIEPRSQRWKDLFLTLKAIEQEL
jgi:GTPase SAR1 family protein